MEKFQNRYRIPSARLQQWDYRWAGAYFITICTVGKEHYFGNIKNGVMYLSNIGVLADVFWHEIKHHARNIDLGAFVIMPNHVHGILVLNDDGDDIINVETMHPVGETHAVETRHALSLQLQSQSPPMNNMVSRFQNPGKNSVSSIIGSYKSAVTKHAHRLGFEFAWQTRFYDHIIRDDQSYQNISNYIINNPKKWDEDKFCITT